MNVTQSIKKANRIVIVAHVKPDGDCLGSGFAVREVCLKYNKKVDIISDSPTPEHLSFIKDIDALNNIKHRDYDLCIVVDCGDITRMGKYEGYAKNVHCLNIDHHKTNTRFGNENHVIDTASSTCEIVFDLLKAEGELSKEVCSYLYVGLSTDTGHFKHSNVTDKVFATASQIASMGVDTYAISCNLYNSNTIERTKLVAKAIGSMRFFRDNEICVISISQQDLESTNSTFADTEGLIGYAISIKPVRVAISITEQPKGGYKCSYRSKDLTIDVSKSAGIFGGGGHAMASGCMTNGHYEDVIAKLVKSVTDFMAD